MHTARRKLRWASIQGSWLIDQQVDPLDPGGSLHRSAPTHWRAGMLVTLMMATQSCVAPPRDGTQREQLGRIATCATGCTETSRLRTADCIRAIASICRAPG